MSDYRGDQPYTLRVTALSLLIGLPIAVLLGALFYSLNQPATQAGGQVTLTINALALPAALLVSGIVLAVSVFWLPMRFARRAERVLDPTLYPMIGVLSLAVLMVSAFVLAIVFKLI